MPAEASACFDTGSALSFDKLSTQLSMSLESAPQVSPMRQHRQHREYPRNEVERRIETVRSTGLYKPEPGA